MKSLGSRDNPGQIVLAHRCATPKHRRKGAHPGRARSPETDSLGLDERENCPGAQSLGFGRLSPGAPLGKGGEEQ